MMMRDPSSGWWSQCVVHWSGKPQLAHAVQQSALRVVRSEDNASSFHASHTPVPEPEAHRHAGRQHPGGDCPLLTAIGPLLNTARRASRRRDVVQKLSRRLPVGVETRLLMTRVDRCGAREAPHLHLCGAPTSRAGLRAQACEGAGRTTRIAGQALKEAAAVMHCRQRPAPPLRDIAEREPAPARP